MEVSLVAVGSIGTLRVLLEETEELHSHLHLRSTIICLLESSQFLEAFSSIFVVTVAEHGYDAPLYGVNDGIIKKTRHFQVIHVGAIVDMAEESTGQAKGILGLPEIVFDDVPELEPVRLPADVRDLR